MEKIVRIYYTTRPEAENGLFKSVVAYMDLDKNDLCTVINISESPVLQAGEEGTFDEDGVMPGAIVRRGDNEYWMYYMGWRRSVSVPYIWTVGVAISKDGGESFKKYGEGPILPIDYSDPYLVVAPRAVFYENDIWHMYYGSGKKWIDVDGKKESAYLIRHAVSKDGIQWVKDANNCIDTVYEDESQGACCICKKEGRYHAFFSYRHSTDFRNQDRGYLIGYAYSDDLVSWVRNDVENLIEKSADGWDSQMICYPFVMKINGKTILFYCGNGFGKGGLGYAELVEY